MYSWLNYKDKFKRYGKLSPKEVKGLFLSIVVIAFIYSFREWGVEKFNINYGLQNLLVTIIIVAISFFVRELAHRAAALSVGYKVEYTSWVLGLLIGLMLAFVSNGYLIFLAPGGIILQHLAIHRLGRHRYAPEYSTQGWIASAGAVANIIFAVFVKIINFSGNSTFLHSLMMVNIWLAIFSLIPVPPLDGYRLFFGSRYIYVFALAAIIACGAMLSLTTHSVLSLIGGLFFGAITLFMFFVLIEKRF